MSRKDIQGYEENLESEIKKIRECDKLKAKDKETLQSFIDYRKQKVSDGRIVSEVNRLRTSLKYNYPGLGLEKICTDKEKFEKINLQIQQSEYYSKDYSNSSKDEFRKAWKRMLEFYFDRKAEIEAVDAQVEKHLPRDYSTNTHTLGENVDPRKTPSADDIKQVCQALESLSKPKFAKRNVAACMTLWDVGCRISGLLRMDVGDVTYSNGKVVEVTVPAVKESPQRPIELTVAGPSLQHFLENVHPEPENPNAPLFSTLKGETKSIDPSDFRQKLDQAKTKTGLDIKFNPHNFRRGRGTFLIVKEICDIRTAATRGGWKQIETLDGYLQQTMEGVNKKVRDVYKSEKVDSEVSGPEADLLPLKCPECEELNSGHKDRCRVCGGPLDSDCIPDGVKSEDKEMLEKRVNKAAEERLTELEKEMKKIKEGKD